MSKLHDEQDFKKFSLITPINYSSAFRLGLKPLCVFESPYFSFHYVDSSL